MKTTITLTFLVLISSLCINAQKPLKLYEDTIAFGKSTYPGLVISIPEVSFDATQKSWTKVLQSGTKSEVVTENGELSIFGCNIKDISADPINVFSKLVNLDSAVQLMAIFELKKDVYIDKAAGDAVLTSAKDFMKEFGKEQYMDVAKDQLQKEEKKLKDLQNELESLRNDKSRMQKSIQSNKTSIIEENDNITVKNNELATVTAELLNQNNQMNTMEDGVAKEEKAKFIKDLEKQKNKILNSIESSENKINKSNSEIDKANNDIPKNESMQETLREKVSSQESVVRNYTDKFNAIKAY